jgi:hypothetical protein
MPFHGFRPELIVFVNELGANNSREWFGRTVWSMSATCSSPRANL